MHGTFMTRKSESSRIDRESAFSGIKPPLGSGPKPGGGTSERKLAKIWQLFDFGINTRV